MGKNISFSGSKMNKLRGGQFSINNTTKLAPRSLFIFDPENEIFFSVTSEISNLDLFIFFIPSQSTKVAIVLYFREHFNQ